MCEDRTVSHHRARAAFTTGGDPLRARPHLPERPSRVLATRTPRPRFSAAAPPAAFTSTRPAAARFHTVLLKGRLVHVEPDARSLTARSLTAHAAPPHPHAPRPCTEHLRSRFPQRRQLHAGDYRHLPARAPAAQRWRTQLLSGAPNFLFYLSFTPHLAFPLRRHIFVVAHLLFARAHALGCRRIAGELSRRRYRIYASEWTLIKNQQHMEHPRNTDPSANPGHNRHPPPPSQPHAAP